MTKKASAAQTAFMTAILKHGGTRVPGTTVFGKTPREDRFKTNTVGSCTDRKWVTREESNGVALWTVTADGQNALKTN